MTSFSDKLDEVLAPIHNSGYFACSYETGRWPKPHDCGLPEAKEQIIKLFQREVIGEDVPIYDTEENYLYNNVGANNLRAEQRKKLRGE